MTINQFYSDGTATVDGSFLKVRVNRDAKTNRRYFYIPEDRRTGQQFKLLEYFANSNLWNDSGAMIDRMIELGHNIY